MVPKASGPGTLASRPKVLDRASHDATVSSEGSPPKTYISDLRPARYATIEAEVAKLEPVREVEAREGGARKVRNGVLRDGTGEIAFVLWGDEVELVVEGDRVRLVDGWVKDYRGKPEVSLGRRGKVEKL